MNSKIKLLVASLTILSWGNMFAESSEMEFHDAVTMTKKGPKDIKCLRVTKNLRVCGDAQFDGDVNIAGNLSVEGNETLDGNLIITGTLVAGDIISTGSLCAEYIFLCPSAASGTPGVPGIGGVLAYGEVASIVGGTGATVTLAAGSAAPATFSYTGPLAGITTHVTGGNIDGLVLGTAGLYLFQYEISDLIGAGLFSNEIALNSNDIQIPASAFQTISVAGLEASTGQINGFVLSQQPAGALIQLVNPGVNLITTGTSAGVNAKLTALRLA